jgi:hypothetical protein
LGGADAGRRKQRRLSRWCAPPVMSELKSLCGNYCYQEAEEVEEEKEVEEESSRKRHRER